MSVVFVQDNAFALRYTVADDKIVKDSERQGSERQGIGRQTTRLHKRS
jgi:hypothetical protein